MSDKVVWILGAGFSKPLGGPLLTELLSPGSIDTIRAAFGSHEWMKDPAVAATLELYRKHLFNERQPPEKPLWHDAEEFLSFVDTAGPGSSRTHRDRLLFSCDLAPFGSAAFLNLAAVARRLIAAECSAFLVGVDPPSMEHWGPYLRWAQSLGPTHTIITFNYDVIPEVLTSIGGRLKTFEPHVATDLANAARVLKLHGSVNWVRNGNSVMALPVDPKYSFLDTPHESVLATPGPTKTNTVRELTPVWTEAEKAIREAGTLIFIGYRFPPSDAESRHRIRTAIAQSQSHYVSVHTVLGPRITDDSARLNWLLLQAVRRGGRAEFVPKKGAERPEDSNSGPKLFNVVPHPGWAEDFLDAAPLGHLMQPWRFVPGGRGY